MRSRESNFRGDIAEGRVVEVVGGAAWEELVVFVMGLGKEESL